VPKGAADGIARFYRNVMGAKAAASVDGAGKNAKDDNGIIRAARVEVGIGQYLMFRETDREIPPYDSHHIQIYVADFSGRTPSCSTRDSSRRKAISISIDSRISPILKPARLCSPSSEVRSMRHPLFMRPLVNRNPAQSNINYAPGYDAWIPA